ncbi:thiolase family protein [Yinghuangia soli]|uniref:Thiolase family protein n=1 Tax=Yinghuangia soli TaxID=2908204 RepID=A0AA41U4P6_9ACTN|nr:thiolase family protein [Yinghuangia soli]MCF2531002.1 thiolase family protein [Yinghuangia soli]
MASDHVWIVGASMTRFARHDSLDALDLAAEAALAALADAGTAMSDMDILAAGSLFHAGAGLGQQLQKQIGQTGIPVYNVANACATGATALRTVHMSILAGESGLGLAVGVEKTSGMGLLGAAARPVGAKKEFVPAGRDGHVMPTEGILGSQTMPSVFAQAGMAYLHANPQASVEHFYKISEKNHAHSELNPLAQYRKRFSLEEIKAAPMISYPNTSLMCSANTDGAAAVVLCSSARLATLPLAVQKRAVKIAASVLTSDPYVPGGQVLPDVSTCTRNAAAAAYERAGIGPEDLDLVELHDCFATAELLHYDNLMLCEPGGAADFLDSGAPWRDGRLPVNVSGGLQSKGHPIGATGIANVYEVATHLRGEAGDRQIDGARVGLTHVIGLGSSAAVHILQK